MSRPYRNWAQALLACSLLTGLITGIAWAEEIRDLQAQRLASGQDAQKDQARYRQWVTDLADPKMEGRGVGTKGLEKAREYLVEQFKAMGLKPLFTQPQGVAFTQAFQAPGDVKLKEKQLKVSAGKEVYEAAHETDYTVMGFSPSRDFSGQVVFVGYSIVDKQKRYDSFKALPANALKGKIAVAFRYEPHDDKGKSQWAQGNAHAGQWTNNSDLTKKARQAAERGAVAILFVNPPARPVKKLRSTSQSIGRAIPIPMLHISFDFFKKIVAAAGNQKADETIKKWISQANSPHVDPPAQLLEGVQIGGSVALLRPKVTIHNVGAVLKGSGKLKDQIVVVGAHYDHLGFGGVGSFVTGKLHPGADDNASGTAGLLMLAQRFADRHKTEWALRDSSVPDLRTMVFVAFSGEERGLLGSAHMTKHFGEAGLDPKRIVAMINMDMIGRLTKDKLTVMGVGTAKEWKDMLAKANREAKLDLKLSMPGMGPSDHTQFYLKNIPVLHFFTGAHKDYHKPSDTADKVNVAGSLRILNVVDAVLTDLWRQPTRVAFQKTQGRVRNTSGRGSGVFLGIVPEYANLEGDKGCGISDVQPNSPAAKGGLKGGDIIIGWNGKKVGNLYDLSARLKESKPDQKVKIEVKRGDKKLTLEVTLGRR